jgi:hypothetical protein
MFSVIVRGGRNCNKESGPAGFEAMPEVEAGEVVAMRGSTNAWSAVAPEEN